MKRETKFLLGGIGIGLAAGILLMIAVSIGLSFWMMRHGQHRARQISGTDAFDVELRDVNPDSPTFDRTVRLSEVWRERGVVLNFMASWCGPCRMELPALESIHASGAASIVCMAADEGAAGTENLLVIVRRSGLTIPVLYADEDQALALGKHYAHSTLPTTYLIDEKGKILKVITGARPEEAFRREIAETLGGSAVARR